MKIIFLGVEGYYQLKELDNEQKTSINQTD